MSSTQDRINGYWDGRAPAFHAHQASSDRAQHECLLWRDAFAAVLPAPSATIFDMGCGSGFLSHVLTDLGHEVTGFDASPGMIAEAQRDAAARLSDARRAASFRHADVLRVAPPRSPIDAVTSRNVLWTLTDPITALTRWASMLRPGGMVACADGLWYPDGIDSDSEVDSTDGPDVFIRAYDDRTLARLPLAQRVGLDDYRRVFERAGLTSITTTIVDTDSLDQRFPLPRGHQPAVQFLISGAKN